MQPESQGQLKQSGSREASGRRGRLTKVVGCILLAGNQLLRVEQLPVCAGADLINHGGLQVQEDGTGHVLAGTRLRKEGVEGIVTTSNGLVRGHLTIRLDAVLLCRQREVRGWGQAGTSLAPNQ